MASATNVIAEGHLGNLTAEQEAVLRQFWQIVFLLYNMFETAGPIVSDVASIKAESTKQSAGWFGRVSAPAPPAPKYSGDVIDALNIITKDEHEQQRLIKQLKQLLAARSPESIRKFKEELASQSPEAIQQLRHVLETQSQDSIREFQKILHGQTAQAIRAMVTAAVKHEHPDMLVLRFLRARKWDVNKSLMMMFKALTWRTSQAHVDDDVMVHGEAGAAEDEKNGDKAAKILGRDFLKQIRMGKSFFHGVDRQNRPITVVRARLHKASDQCVESIERYTTYLCETGRFALTPPVETACLIFDLTGFTLANMDYVPIKFMIMCFEANYPESLGVILIHNAPWVFKACWRIIHGWLDPVIASKVNFTYTRQDLEEFIAPDRLIKELGGDEDWEYKYEEPVPGENAAMADTESRDRLIREREDIAVRFEAVTKEWVLRPDGHEGEELRAKREAIAKEIQENYWSMDKYVRARSLYDRQGNLRGGGEVRWYDYKQNGTTNGSA